MMLAQKEKLFPLLFALVGFLVSFFTFYPGFMTSDAIDQYTQAQTFTFYASHPTIMAWIWSILNSFWEGPQVMLLAQLSFYWAAVYFLLHSLPIARPKWVTLSICGLLLAPNVVNFLGVIWKDVWLMSLWMLVFSYTYNKRAQAHNLSGTEKLWLLVAIGVGGLMRWNGMLVSGPLILYVMEGKPVLSNFWRTIGFYAFSALLLIGINAGINKILNTPPANTICFLLEQDLGGVLVKTGKNPFPFELSEEEVQKIKRCWTPENLAPLLWGECSFLHHKGEIYDSNMPMIKAWANSVLDSPLVYLENRLDYFSLFLTSSHSTSLTTIEQNPYGLSVKPHGLLYVLRAYMNVSQDSLFLRPLTWLLLAFGLLLFSIFKKNLPSSLTEAERTSSITSILYILTDLPLGVSLDFRYIYLSILMTTFGLCILISRFSSRLTSVPLE